MPSYESIRFLIICYAFGSLSNYLSFSGLKVEVFEKSYCKIYGLLYFENKALTDYLLTWLWMSIIEFNSSGLWFF